MRKYSFAFIAFLVLGLLLGACGTWLLQEKEIPLGSAFTPVLFTDLEVGKGKSQISGKLDSAPQVSWELKSGYEYPFAGIRWLSKDLDKGCFNASSFKSLKIKLSSPSQPGSWFFINAKTMHPTEGDKTVRQSAHADGTSQELDFEHFIMPEWYALDNKISPDKQNADWQNLCSFEILIQEPNAAQGRLQVEQISLVVRRGSPWPWFAGMAASFLLAFGFRPSRHKHPVSPLA